MRTDLILYCVPFTANLGVGEDVGGGSDHEEDRKNARQVLHSLASTDDAQLRNLAERYKQSSKIIEDLEDFPVDPHEAMAIRQSLLPTTADPAMWQVKCQVRTQTDGAFSFLQ